MQIQELIKFGIVNIDKPAGPTSHQVAEYVKKILKIKKSGHSGTLDPGVTGCLPVALGNATRIMEVLLKHGKEYVCVMELHKDVDEKDIKKALLSFKGKIKQIPPVKSAVKREERVREIYDLEILEIKKRLVLFRVSCEAGTYIRRLCLHPNTEILTTTGLKFASDFFLSPLPIFSFEMGKITKKNSSATQKISSPLKLLKITMSSGISFTVTPDHELLTSKNKDYRMIESNKLKKGDYLVKSLHFPDISVDFVIADFLDDFYYVQQKEIKEKCKRAFISKYGSIRSMHRKLGLDRKAFLSNSKHAITIQHLKLSGIYDTVKAKLHTFKTQKGKVIKMKDLNEDFFYLLGLIASDGNNTKEKNTVRHTRIRFYNKNEVLIDTFLKMYKKLFPNIPISKKLLKTEIWQLDSSNSFLATIAASLGVTSPQKYNDLLPIVNAKNNLIKVFLKGYFDGDGSVYFKKTFHNCKTKICFHSGNYSEAKRLHQMLLKVGIPNIIFKRKTFMTSFKKVDSYYNIVVGKIRAQKKFIREIGSNHPFKLNIFKKILNLEHNSEIYDHYYVALHFKEEIRKNKSKLHSAMGGNLYRILNNTIPITRRFYARASQFVRLPLLDEFIVEEIKSIKKVTSTEYVYDMTVPETHNFLIETGFVSSNCDDAGKKLETGAHMKELRRTRAGIFDESTLVTLNDLRDAYEFWKEGVQEKDKEKEVKGEQLLKKFIQPIEVAVKDWNKVILNQAGKRLTLNGQNLREHHIEKVEGKKGEDVAVFYKKELIALGVLIHSSKDIKENGKKLVVNVKKVFVRG
jgi:tRNA pseudouridine(55) synthase